MMMSDSLISLVLMTAATVLNVVVQLGSYRASPRVGYMKSVLLGFAAGGLLLMGGEVVHALIRTPSVLEMAIRLAGDGAVYICLGYLFFNYINVGEASIRVRIIREIDKAPSPLSERGLLAAYNDYVILNTRLGRLLGNGQIVEENGRYLLRSPILISMALIIRFFKQLLLRRLSEFDGHNP